MIHDLEGLEHHHLWLPERSYRVLLGAYGSVGNTQARTREHDSKKGTHVEVRIKTRLHFGAPDEIHGFQNFKMLLVDYGMLHFLIIFFSYKTT